MPPVLTLVRSLLVATLVARLAQQLAVLLLRHPLAALLDDRTHVCPCRETCPRTELVPTCVDTPRRGVGRTSRAEQAHRVARAGSLAQKRPRAHLHHAEGAAGPGGRGRPLGCVVTLLSRGVDVGRLEVLVHRIL